MECFVVTTNRRTVTVPAHTRRGKGHVEEQMIEVFDTDVWFFWIASSGKKENNWSTLRENVCVVVGRAFLHSGDEKRQSKFGNGH